jgi:hypothetical protein
MSEEICQTGSRSDFAYERVASGEALDTARKEYRSRNRRTRDLLLPRLLSGQVSL